MQQNLLYINQKFTFKKGKIIQKICLENIKTYSRQSKDTFVAYVEAKNFQS